MTSMFTHDKATILAKVRYAQKLVRAIPDDGEAYLNATNWAMATDAVVSLIVAYNLIANEIEFASARLAISSDTGPGNPPTLLDPIGTRVSSGPLRVELRAVRDYNHRVACAFESIIGLLTMRSMISLSRNSGLMVEEVKVGDEIDRQRLSVLLVDLIEFYTTGDQR